MKAGEVQNLLFVDDEEALADMLCERIQRTADWRTTHAATAEDALRKCGSDRYDIIILDVGLPDMDGRDLCRVLRRRGVDSLIVMLTGADTDADTIVGLDAGADDYITKPVRVDLLLARLSAHLRQRALR